MKQKLLIAIGASGLLGLLALAAAIAYLFLWLPRQTLRAFDEFTLVHKEGTPIDALAADPFLLRASDLTFDEASLKDLKPGAPARQVERFRAQLKEPGQKGVLEITWTHTPPFGRAFLHVEYADGVVKSLQTTDLD